MIIHQLIMSHEMHVSLSLPYFVVEPSIDYEISETLSDIVGSVSELSKFLSDSCIMII